MGSCAEGYHDINGSPDDGCEYSCTSTGPEICDHVDNDCNGLKDEQTNLQSDPVNCGDCGRVCKSPPHANSTCASGQCAYSCLGGFYDNNGLAEDGCEGIDCVPAEEVCDGRDNDCNCVGDSNNDGVVCGPGDDGVDEGFDKSLVTSCGPYCTLCSFAHSKAKCDAGACELGDCDADWYDADRITETGCEYHCVPTGVEQCDSIDNDCDGQVDEGEACIPSCPADMVAVGTAYCVDRYEASRKDATEVDPGQDESMAISRSDVMPWMVNPMSGAHLVEFQAACVAADKYLCSRDEWFAACTGPDQLPYVHGGTFDREACNCVDTYCDDYCEEHAIDSTQCDTRANCGYSYNCYHAVPTGRFAACTNDYDTFDMNGNVWEIVTSSVDARGYEVRGGAFNCASASVRVNCSYNAGWLELYAGFRCCKSIAP